MALQAILEDTFLLLAGLPESALDSDAPDPNELAAPGPLDGAYLECQIAVFVDVPSEGIHLQVRAGQLGFKNSNFYIRESSLNNNMECCRCNHHVLVSINEGCRIWSGDRIWNLEHCMGDSFDPEPSGQKNKRGGNCFEDTLINNY